MVRLLQRKRDKVDVIGGDDGGFFYFFSFAVVCGSRWMWLV